MENTQTKENFEKNLVDLKLVIDGIEVNSEAVYSPDIPLSINVLSILFSSYLLGNKFDDEFFNFKFIDLDSIRIYSYNGKLKTITFRLLNDKVYSFNLPDDSSIQIGNVIEFEIMPKECMMITYINDGIMKKELLPFDTSITFRLPINQLMESDEYKNNEVEEKTKAQVEIYSIKLYLEKFSEFFISFENSIDGYNDIYYEDFQKLKEEKTNEAFKIFSILSLKAFEKYYLDAYNRNTENIEQVKNVIDKITNEGNEVIKLITNINNLLTQNIQITKKDLNNFLNDDK